MLFLQLLVVLLFPARCSIGYVVTALKKEVQSLRQIHDAGSVNAALALLRQHIARAAGIFDHDPHATLAALGKTGGFC